MLVLFPMATTDTNIPWVLALLSKFCIELLCVVFLANVNITNALEGELLSEKAMNAVLYTLANWTSLLAFKLFLMSAIPCRRLLEFVKSLNPNLRWTSLP